MVSACFSSLSSDATATVRPTTTSSSCKVLHSAPSPDQYVGVGVSIFFVSVLFVMMWGRKEGRKGNLTAVLDPSVGISILSYVLPPHPSHRTTATCSLF
eukprot:scaffold30594_cov154-Skeletonema_menzelii.AAC.3